MRKLSRRRRLSMTSLIDVIFLLLLFFMLSSTFSRFGEIDLLSAASGQGGTGEDAPLFLRVDQERLSLNGQETDLEDLADALALKSETAVLVSLQGAPSSQRLVDVLVVLRRLPDLTVTVLGGMS